MDSASDPSHRRSANVMDVGAGGALLVNFPRWYAFSLPPYRMLKDKFRLCAERLSNGAVFVFVGVVSSNRTLVFLVRFDVVGVSGVCNDEVLSLL